MYAPGSHGRMCTFQEACSGGENMVKSEKLEDLIELVQKHTSLYDLVSLDHMDAIRNGNIWASISRDLGHPRYDWRGLPQFFWIWTFPEIYGPHIWVRVSFSGKFNFMYTFKCRLEAHS